MKKINVKVELCKETRGNVPYVVMWISLAGFPSINHYATMHEAIDEYTWLKTLGCRPSLMQLLEVKGGN